MNIISQINDSVIKNLQLFMNKYIINTINGFDNPYNIDSYKQMMIDFDNFISNLSIDLYVDFIGKLDNDFMSSSTRKQLYHSKGFVTKPLLTKFGIITFKRRRYVNKVTGESFMFVDRFLGLSKYCRMDPFIVAELLEESAENSYSKAGRIVSKQIGEKIKFNDNPNKYIISRATARNVVLKANENIQLPENDDYHSVKVLNVMLDEKFVGSQFNDDKDHMIKAAVVFEDTILEYRKRVRLTGKQVFGSISGDLLTQVMDYIYYHYDTSKLEVINFMGDGATWITSFAKDSAFKYHKNLDIKFGLDHFHLSQAVTHITTKKYSKDYGPILKDYIFHDQQKDFLDTCDSLILLQPEREEIILEKVTYIKNHWKHIQTSFHDIKFKCSMESNISHVFADMFTARPRAYSEAGLKSLLKLRLLKINGHDIKRLHFDSLSKNSTKEKEERVYQKHVIKNTYSRYNDFFSVQLPIVSSSGISISIKKINNYIPG